MHGKLFMPLFGNYDSEDEHACGGKDDGLGNMLGWDITKRWHNGACMVVLSNPNFSLSLSCSGRESGAVLAEWTYGSGHGCPLIALVDIPDDPYCSRPLCAI